MPRHYTPTPPRPPRVCACGETYQPAPKGPIPRLCLACRVASDRAAAVVRLAATIGIERLDGPAAMRAGAALIKVGQRGTRKARRGGQ